MAEHDFEVVKVIKSVDGVVATVTSRERNGRKLFTFSMKKEFEKDGKTSQTPWLQKQHVNSVRALLDEIETFMEHEEDKARAKYRDRLAK